MVSRTGKFVIGFNGEIYNHLELRAELDSNPELNNHSGLEDAKLQWRGHSDTETLLIGLSIGV